MNILTFNEFDASFLNKIISLVHTHKVNKKRTNPKLWMVLYFTNISSYNIRCLPFLVLLKA